MASAPEILPQVTSPLALTALLLLVGGGVIRVIARQKDRAGLRTALRWIVGAAVALGALANLSYVAGVRMSSETRIAGKVFDEGNNPLPRVIVELVGTGSRGITDDSGDFSFTLPASRKAADYEVLANLPGYMPVRETHAGPQPPSRLSLVLKRPGLNPAEILSSEGPSHVLHQLGLPFVDFSLAIHNPLPWAVLYKRLQITLYSPDEPTIPKRFDGYGSFLPITNQYSPIFLAEGRIAERADYASMQRYSFIGERPDELISRALADAQRTYDPRTGSVTLSPALVTDLKGFTERNWFWVAGQWVLEASVMMDDRPVVRRFRFTLNADQVRRMKEVSARYIGGWGVLPDRPFPPEVFTKIVLIPE